MRTNGLAVLGVMAALAAPSLAGVDVPVGAKARVLSTHSPADEVEVFRFDATAEATLKVVVVGGRRTDLDFDVTLIGPGEAPIDLSTAPRFRDTGKRVSAAGLVLEETGAYRIEVAGAGTGNYKLVLRVTPKRRYSETFDLAAAATDTLPFAAPSSARLTFRATAPRGSSATPRFGAFDGDDLGDDGRRTDRLHSVSLPAIAAGGELALPVRNDGDEQGEVVVSVVVRPLRGRDRLNYRSENLGQVEGDETVLGQNVGSDGGLVDVADADSDLDGAGVDVPSGALPIPTRITVTSAADIPPDDDTEPGGPAVEFGPEGLEFIEDATIVLPLDISLLPIGTVAADIRVIKVDGDGNKTFIDPDDDDVDLDGGTVTIATSSFSVYQSNVPKGTPNLRGRGFWTVSLKLALEPDRQEGGDSRDRVLRVQAGNTRFLGPQTVTGGVSAEIEERRVTLTHGAEGEGLVEASSATFTDRSLAWRLEPDQRRVTISTVGGTSNTVTMGRRGSMLLEGLEADNGENEVFASISLQRRRRPPPESALTGTYWFAALKVRLRSGSGPADVALSREFGSVTLRPNGTFVVVQEESQQSFAGSRFVARRDTGTATGKWGVDRTPGLFFGTVLLRPGDAAGAELRLLPHRDGNVLAGVEAGVSTNPQMLVLMRRSTNLRARSLPAEFAAVRVGVVEPSTYTVRGSSGEVVVPDFSVQGGSQILKLPGDGTLSVVDAVDLTLTRDERVGGGVRRAFAGPENEPPRSIYVSREGRLGLPGTPRLVGAISPDRLLGFALDAPGGKSTATTLTLFIDPAPAGSPPPVKK